MTLPPLMLTERAERLLCLARAFLPPRAESAREAICSHLAADLLELQHALGGNPEPAVALKRTIESLDSTEQLLTTYSRLFLAPPAPALPNLGFYLDGAMMGSTCQTIESLYLKYGLERDAQHFKDAADHVALYLQFLGWLMAHAEEHRLAGDTRALLETLTDAVQTLTRHAEPALKRLQEQILKTEHTMSLPTVYGQLTSLALAATTDDNIALRAYLPARPPLAARPRSAQAPHPTAEATQSPPVACNSCGTDFVADEGLVGMITVLEAQGLDTAHMRICPKCRTAAMGMTALKIPTLKKAS
ncbi:MAG TPA: molecular chaperone TorD family protein [Azoarcus taiwanensis]|nr:molecular chaperone TorD family protein [Azoarcus taiwanensis]